MPWKLRTINEFRRVPLSATHESRWYGPWDSLLHELWPHDDGFQITQQYHPTRNAAHVDWTVLYVVQHLEVPVCLIEIKPYYHLNLDAKRASADDQLRERMDDMKDYMRLDKMYGISACGPQFGVWKVEKAVGRNQVEKGRRKVKITPPRIHRDEDTLSDTAPVEWWPYDVLSQEGEERLRTIVTEMSKLLEPYRSDEEATVEIPQAQ